MTCFIFCPGLFFSENANKQRSITSFSLLWNNRASLLINDDIHLFFYPSSLRLLHETQGMRLYGNSDQPVSNSVTHDPFLHFKVRDTLNARALIDLRTFQTPPEPFTLTAVGLIEKKCLVGYVVSVTAHLFHPLPRQQLFFDSLSYKKIDNYRQLKPLCLLMAIVDSLCVCTWS